jgi:UDP-3-O-[3-hydroxymyristoyl] glucosamine N-acyltransferase
MEVRNTITIDQVLGALQHLGISYSWHGLEREVHKVCSLLSKEDGGLYYFSGSDPAMLDGLLGSVVICRTGLVHELSNISTIEVDVDPQLVFYKLCAHLFGSRPPAGIHPTAIIHPEARLGAGVFVGPYVVIGRSVIGNDTTIHSHSVIMDDCTIGDRVVIEPYCGIGVSGAVWMWDDDGQRLVLPQVGRVDIGNDVFLGAHVAIVRGLFNEATTLGDRCKLAPGSKLGHSVVMEEDCHLANNVSIAGSAYLGAGCFLGSGSSVRSHAKLAPDTIVGNGAAVTADVLVPGTTVAGVPARPLPAKEMARRGVPKGGRGR